MSDKARVALALAAGYYLGRRHKLRMAATLAAASVAGRYRKGDGGLLAQGSKILGSSPEIDELTSRLRGQVMDVGKAAVIAAATRQINSLTEKLQERTESLQRGDQAEDELEDEPRDEYEDDEEVSEDAREAYEPEEAPEPPHARHARKPGAGRKRPAPVTRTAG
ncbi:hypothetical protein [Nonomuraea diastatica]|uniref:Histone protein n=1 Tax=Nonomuraea diastatica TaxID=1848329 RepID=A0A4R4WFG9_9ACTN|nr:hypothetical protein [Nonomuraea diastatica]TDD17652.1 hypothetical protein E1294_27240 [Nonomuraea diastatica]